MLEFLSDEWVDALDAVAQRTPALTAVEPLVVEHVVVDAPGRDEVRYHVVLGPPAARFRRGGAPTRDVSFTTEYPVAAALARGDINAQQALAAGRLRVGGDLHRLNGAASAFASLGDVFAAVREETSYR